MNKPGQRLALEQRATDGWISKPQPQRPICMRTQSIRIVSWTLLLLVGLPLAWNASLVAEDRQGTGPQIPSWIRRWSRTNHRSSPAVMSAFREVVRRPRSATVGVLCGGTQVAHGTIVSANGLILTKASELTGDVHCQLSDGRLLPAQLLTTDQTLDLAALRIGATDLVPIDWNHGQVPAPGSWLAIPGLEQEPVAIGVVSAPARPIRAPRAILGVVLDSADDTRTVGVHPARIIEVLPDSSAQQAGLKAEDLIVKLNGSAVSATSLMEELSRLSPGDQVRLAVQRSSEQLETTATLTDVETTPGGRRANQQKSLGRELSRRNAGFPTAFQHDAALRPNECGGPLVDLDGKAVGINIASADRVSTLALPASAIQPLLARLEADLSQSVANTGN